MLLPFFDRVRARSSSLRYLVPAAALFAASAFLPAAAAVTGLLLADAFALAALAGFAGFRSASGARVAQLQRIGSYAALLIGYTALLFALTAYPLQWLLRERSLGATLAVSTEIVVALLCLWRLWPCFGLLFTGS